MTADTGPADVILVEDNPAVRRLFVATLQAEGYAVRDTSQGTTALRFFRERRPGLLVTDFVLPDMEGTRLVAAIRELPGGADLPVLVLTGLVSRLDDIRGMVAGPVEVHSKPIEPSVLAAIAASYLRARGA